MDWLYNIKKIKNDRGITNEEIARLSSIPVGTLNKLLSGKTPSIKLDTLQALANALGVSINAVLGGECDISDDEYEIIKMLRELDGYEYDRMLSAIKTEYDRAVMRKNKGKRFIVESELTRQIVLYDSPVSAGCGNYLDSDSTKKLTLTLNEVTDRADFALRVRGDSMEPRYCDGDIVIVESGAAIERGKIGIFILNGESYIKKFGGDRLISLNPKYSDIVLSESDHIECKGIVLGKLCSA